MAFFQRSGVGPSFFTSYFLLAILHRSASATDISRCNENESDPDKYIVEETGCVRPWCSFVRDHPNGCKCNGDYNCRSDHCDATRSFTCGDWKEEESGALGIVLLVVLPAVFLVAFVVWMLYTWRRNRRPRLGPSAATAEGGASGGRASDVDGGRTDPITVGALITGTEEASSPAFEDPAR